MKASIWRRVRSGPARQNTSPSAGNRVTSRDDDPVNRDRVGGKDEIEKAPAERRQRGADIGGVELARRKSLEMALAHAPHHCAEELFLAGEMRIDGRLGDAGLARDRVHADRAKSAGEKGSRRRGEDAFDLAAGPNLGAFDLFHRPLAGEHALDSL